MPRTPLFGDGLGLDSIDALELALAISREYGLELKSDEERNRSIFANLRSLARHVETHRTRVARHAIPLTDRPADAVLFRLPGRERDGG